jgi:hypothetical protein
MMNFERPAVDILIWIDLLFEITLVHTNQYFCQHQISFIRTDEKITAVSVGFTVCL